MIISQMMPDDIYSVFVSRISKTNLLYDLLTDDSPIEMSNAIYFKYYFDISTAIEATLRGITFEVCSDNRYLEFLAQPDSSSKAFFLKYGELKALVPLDSLFDSIKKEEFNKKFCANFSPLTKHIIKCSFKNDGTFKDIYNRVRDIRNALAHGLNSNNIVSFENSIIEEYIYVLYILLTYYKKIISHKT